MFAMLPFFIPLFVLHCIARRPDTTIHSLSSLLSGVVSCSFPSHVPHLFSCIAGCVNTRCILPVSSTSRGSTGFHGFYAHDPKERYVILLVHRYSGRLLTTPPRFELVLSYCNGISVAFLRNWMMAESMARNRLAKQMAEKCFWICVEGCISHNCQMAQ